MKRLIPAGILLLTVILSYIFSLSYITSTCNEVNDLIDKCESAYINGENSYETAEKLKDTWSGKEKILSLFVNHDKIDDIELELSSLLIYSKSDSSNIFYEHIAVLKMLLHQIKEDTEINSHSIF